MIRFLAASLSTLFLLTSCSEQEEISSPSTASKPAPLSANAVGEFFGENAYTHVETLTSFGPRPPESEGYRKSLQYLEKELHQLGWKTQRQTFKGDTPTGPINFTNLLARYSPDQNPDWTTSVPYLLCSHLDTKRYPNIVFLGANDSGSSSGLLVELARVLKNHEGSAKSVELVFFDGEEAILENIRGRDGLYGSKFYAGQLNNRSNKPQLAIVLDIVGDKNIPLLIGSDSHENLKAHTTAAANTLGLSDQVVLYQTPITDDHVPLMARAQLPVLHLIGDFSQTSYWHTAKDTMENLSPEALENTGKLTLQVLHQLTSN